MSAFIVKFTYLPVKWLATFFSVCEWLWWYSVEEISSDKPQLFCTVSCLDFLLGDHNEKRTLFSLVDIMDGKFT